MSEQQTANTNQQQHQQVLALLFECNGKMLDVTSPLHSSEDGSMWFTSGDWAKPERRKITIKIEEFN